VVSEPEPIGDLAAVFLARLWHRQPQGDRMPNPDAVMAEARRHHAAVCRGDNPDATDEQIDFYWATLGDGGRHGFLRTAEQRLDEGATR
jgi:hypothetical protein